MLVRALPNPQKTLAELVQTGHLRLHFSQFGEDAVLWTHLQSRQNGFYVDVGCHHPFRYSNTALFAIGLGWSGINIDLDERAIAAFQECRPNDINLSLAVSVAEGETEVTVFDDGAVNTLDPEMANDSRWSHLNPTTKRVPMRTLCGILNEHLPAGKPIDLLNVDVEGWALEVLKSNDWMVFRPAFIAVEVDRFSLNAPVGHPVFDFLRANGYNLVGHAFMTSIYQRAR